MNKKTIMAVLGILIIGFLGLFLFKNRVSYGQDVKPQSSESFSNTTEGSIIEITTSGFQPKSLTIKPKTLVTWINKSGKEVSINSNPHPSHEDYPPLNLGVVKEGNSVSLVFETAGIFNYHDHFNPSATGTIVVE